MAGRRAGVPAGDDAGATYGRLEVSGDRQPDADDTLAQGRPALLRTTQSCAYTPMGEVWFLGLGVGANTPLP